MRSELTPLRKMLRRYHYQSANASGEITLPQVPNFLVPTVKRLRHFGVEVSQETGTLPPYVAQAVVINGTYVAIDSLVATDTDFTSFSFWYRHPTGTGASVYPWLVDEWNAMSPSMQGWDNGGGNLVQAFMLDKPGDWDWQDNVISNTLADDTWYHFLGCANTNLGSGSKIFTMYQNDVLLTSVNQKAQVGYTIPVNGKSFNVGAMGMVAPFSPGPIEVADFWFSTQSLLDGNTIPEATRRKFIDANGKPVNPSQFPVGGCVLFSGDKDSFPVNQLSGGTAYVGDGASNTTPLTDATTSPSD